MATQEPAGRADDRARPVDPTQTRALIARHAFVSAMLDALAEGIVACDADGQLVLFNQSTMTFHGLPAMALPPEAWAEHYDLYDADGATPLERDRIPLFRALNGEDVRNQGMVIDPAEGRTRHLLASGNRILDDDGTVLGAVVAMHDVTDRLAAEARARDAAVEQARAERLQELHRTTARLRSVSEVGELGPLLATDLLALTDAAACRVRVAGVAHGDVGPGSPALTVTRDDVTVDVWATGEALPADTAETVQEVTAVAAAVRESMQLRADLLESRAQQLRDQLIAAVSHEIQTPTATIIGLARTLEHEGADLSADELATIGQAVGRQARSLHALVGNFVDHCRLETGQPLRLHLADLALADAARSAIELQSAADRVETDIDDEVVIRGDGDRIVRMVSALVDNALAYSDGPVHVRVARRAATAVIEVSDRGRGLGPDADAMFDRYVRGSTTRDGSGLGLYLGRSVAEAHGGTLTAAEAAGGGAVLTAVLPLAPT